MNLASEPSDHLLGGGKAPARRSRVVRALMPKERAPRGLGWPIFLSLLPGTLLFATFFLVPLGVVIVTSFSDWSVLGLRFIGLSNYTTLIHDSVFWQAAKNTAFYAAAGVLIQIPLAVIVAIILSQRIRGWRVLRTILFVPVVISGAAYALIFSNFYDASYGPLNRLLSVVGIGGRDWLFNIHTAIYAIAGTYIFNIGFFMILVMTEITSLPLELSEAAEVDGASRLQRQRWITLPLLRHVIGTCVLLSLLSSVSFFDIVFILTGGGPDNATLSLTVYGYQVYANDQWGYANAIGVFIVGAGFILILATRRVFRLGERYT